MTQKQKEQKIPKAEIQRAIDDSVKGSDEFRVIGLENLANFRTKKSRMQDREKQRLLKKYGDVNHPRIQQLEAKQTMGIEFIQGLKMELTRAKTPPCKVDENTWMVQGHVYDRTGNVVANAKVSLFGINEEKIKVVKEVNTDKNGFYKLSYLTKTDNAKTTDAEAAIKAERLIKSSKDAALEDGNSSRTEATKKMVFVRAAIKEDSSICADSTPILPYTGTCNYRDIIIDFDQQMNAEDCVEKDRRSGQYLGNSATRELHDLKNEKKSCQIDAIRFDHVVHFKTQKQAIAAGYDYCAYCFGKKLSKR